MTRIIADISVSLDGFVTGPDPSPDNSLGTGGEALDVILMGGAAGRLGARRRAGRRADAAPRARRARCRDTTVHRRSAAHAGAAERGLGIDRDAPDLRRLPVIR